MSKRIILISGKTFSREQAGLFVDKYKQNGEVVFAYVGDGEMDAIKVIDNKVLFIDNENFSIYGLKNIIHRFTINNGCYPDVIEMDTREVDHYLSLLINGKTMDRNKLDFRGIKIKEIKWQKIKEEDQQ